MQLKWAQQNEFKQFSIFHQKIIAISRMRECFHFTLHHRICSLVPHAGLQFAGWQTYNVGQYQHSSAGVYIYAKWVVDIDRQV